MKTKVSTLILAAVTALSVLLLAGLLSVVGCVDTRKDAKPSNEFSFDFNNPQQTIHSFGASDCWRGQYLGLNWPLEKRNQMADYLFSTEMDELVCTCNNVQELFLTKLHFLSNCRNLLLFPYLQYHPGYR